MSVSKEDRTLNGRRTSRRAFIVNTVSAAAGGLVTVNLPDVRMASAESQTPKSATERREVLKLMMFDLNWSYHVHPHRATLPSAPHDWAFIDPQAYVDWQLEIGNNAIFLQAYTYPGYAFYPTRLGPVAPGPGQELLPKVYEITRKLGLPFYSYFCVAADGVMNVARDDWLIPGSRRNWNHGFFGPESPWTEFFCARVEEFLKQFPVDWILFDWFCYGNLTPDYPVQPAWFVEKPFAEIIGRPMPKQASEITPEESLKYKREVLARQFYQIRDTVKRASPDTKIVFTPPYWAPAEPLWVDHPMLNESDALLAEYSKPATMEWLLSIRKPHQAVIATPICVSGAMDLKTMLSLMERGCGMCGYCWGTPPVLKPHPSYDAALQVVKQAFRKGK